MKNKVYIAFFCCLWAYSTQSQPLLNERYRFNDETKAVFGSVVCTDSCYYIAGINGSAPFLSGRKGAFIKMGFDGTPIQYSSIENDTMGIDMWLGYNMIPTLDNNFACMSLAFGENSENAYIFLKIAPNGDTLFTNYLYDFYEESGVIGVRSGTLIQDTDSTYYGVLGVYRESDLEGGTLFYRLDKNGELISYNVFYQLGHFERLIPKGLVKLSDSTLLISSTMSYSDLDDEDSEYFTKFIEVDTNGVFLSEHKLLEDTLALDCNSLTKTAGDGYLYCGRSGKYLEDEEFLGFKLQVLKLNGEFDIEWSIKTDLKYSSGHNMGMYKILPLNASEFVVIGNIFGKGNFSGYLMKFNISGERLWQRHYFKVPHYSGEINWARHELYDVEQTPDGGFVMVGQAVNYHENPEPMGQMGWLVKTNPYGCIVPGCQFGDKPVDAEPKDTTIMNPPEPQEPKTWLYPNPASKSLFYYHHQDEFNFGTAYIYNSSGQLVQKWSITTNDITYEIDVSGFASGQYVLQVLDGDGVEVETERFVKI